MTWGKIASWGVAAAMTAGFWPAVSQAQATVHAAALALPPAGYTPGDPPDLHVDRAWFGRQAG